MVLYTDVGSQILCFILRFCNFTNTIPNRATQIAVLVQVTGNGQGWNVFVEGMKVGTSYNGFVFGGRLMLLHPDCQSKPMNENGINSEL